MNQQQTTLGTNSYLQSHSLNSQVLFTRERNDDLHGTTSPSLQRAVQ